MCRKHSLMVVALIFTNLSQTFSLSHSPSIICCYERFPFLWLMPILSPARPHPPFHDVCPSHPWIFGLKVSPGNLPIAILLRCWSLPRCVMTTECIPICELLYTCCELVIHFRWIVLCPGLFLMERICFPK